MSIADTKDENIMKLLITGASGFIGTNLVTSLIEAGYEICNVDSRPPLNSSHTDFWREGSIMSMEEMTVIMNEYRPDMVIHLAARTDCDENTTVEDDYQLNVQGTRMCWTPSKVALLSRG